jgi:hypothetical protein
LFLYLQKLGGVVYETEEDELTVVASAEVEVPVHFYCCLDMGFQVRREGTDNIGLGEPVGVEGSIGLHGMYLDMSIEVSFEMVDFCFEY